MSEDEWLASSSPYDLLSFLDGKIADRTFMLFSVACCKRIWHLITDARSRAVVDATDRFLRGETTSEEAASVYDCWYQAYQEDALTDAVGGNTHEAIQYLAHEGWLAACSVASSCFESVGFAASSEVISAGASGDDIHAVWSPARRLERIAQCQLLREIVGNPFR